MFEQNNLNKQVKESLDNLPTGIIFAKENGIILLANKTMYTLYAKLSNEVLRSAHIFWESLYDDSLKAKIIDDGEMPTLIFDDATVYNFSKTKFILNGQSITQIDAVDITELYNLRLDLVEKNKQIAEIRAKLFATRKELEKIISEEEYLDAKLKIHNTMGTGLASIRRFLMTGEGDIDKNINTLKKSLELLNRDEKFEHGNQLMSLFNAAKSVGIEIEIIGEWIQNKKITKVVIWVARECLINAAIHAEAKKMYIVIDEKELAYTVSFRNDGLKPKKEIKAGGGFSSITQAVEEINGKLDIDVSDEFNLTITVPK